MASKNVRIWAAIIALALLATACGDSGDGGDTAADVADTSAVTAATTEAEPDDTSVTLGTLVENIPGINDECLAIAQLFSVVGVLSLAAVGQSDVDADDARKQFDDLRSQLPGALQDDIDTMAAGMEEYFDALADLDIDLSDPNAFASASPSDLAALEEVFTIFDSEEFNGAIDNLSAYAEEQCPE